MKTNLPFTGTSPTDPAGKSNTAPPSSKAVMFFPFTITSEGF
jgi:hypothetical protein